MERVTMIWKMSHRHSSIGRAGAVSPRFSLRAHRLVAGFALALFFLCTLYSVAAAQIVLDGSITEPDWHVLGTSSSGPTPGFGAGHEINALAAEINATHLYIGVAGNVQFGNRILVFIDSMPGGYTNSNFGRNLAPPGIGAFYPTSGTSFTQFDDKFTPNYVLVIGTDNGQVNYFWDLYTLSGSVGSGGGPNLFLGDRNNEDLRASPANGSQTQGFEARLTYSANGAGVDIAINQPEIRMMAAYINDTGFLSNQFISRANPGEGNYGGGQVFFNAAAPGPVRFGNMLVVNEVDYIQPGANVAEFIELKNITNFSVNLDSYRLRFARGVNSPPEIYRDIDLPNVLVAPGGYFVICTNPANVPNCTFTVEPPMDLLENAIPAAVALVQNDVIVDVVSYGGNTGFPYTEGAGVLPTDDGTAVGLGVSRVVDGVDTNRNNVDFGLRCVTPGQANNTPTSGCGPVTPPTFTPTWTPTATGTPTPTGSPTPTPTGSVVPPPAGCTNVLVNGDFEAAYGWEFGGSPIPGKYTSIPVHGGVRAVQLGITPESGYAPVYTYSSVRQAVSIPRGATVQLRWWHFHKTELPVLDSTNNTQDRQEVILLKPNGDTLRVLQRVRRNDGNWQQSVLDLTEYAGHSFSLYFNVINYGAGRTWTFLDDIELLVCTPGSVTYPTFVPTPTPTFSQFPTATPTLTPTPTTTPPGTQPGNTVERDGYSLTALTVENPSARYSSSDPPSAGEKFVGVEIIVRNVSGASFDSNPFSATLVDAAGFVHAASSVRSEDSLDLLRVDVGQMIQGWVGFNIPQNATPAILRYQFLGTNVELQVGLGANTVSSAAAIPFADASVLTSAPSPTVTPTNTGSPSPTPPSTVTTEALGPGAVENTLVQQAVPTPTVVLVANRNVIPDGCTEVIKNGGFDALGMGWSHEGSRILPEYSAPATTDIAIQTNRAIRLGLVGDNSSVPGVSGISATQQLVQLPADAKRIALSFRYFTLYETPPSPGDFQYVDIYQSSTGQFLGRVLGIQQNQRTWLTRNYDLTALAGEEIRLFFMVSNDGVGGRIAMYVDDVSILACRTNEGVPLNTFAAAPVEQSIQQPLPTHTQPAVVSTLAPSDQLGAHPPAKGSPFGRLSGLLAVVGIAGAALLLFPFIRRAL
jgi:hypothetical protein